MPARFERFLPPLLNANTVNRQGVVKQIDQSAKRGILFIHAPAGYGKTTAAALWSCGKNVAWFTLDEYSAAAADIFRWLLVALSCEVPDDFTNAPLKCLLDTLQTLENWPEALVIDDFHLCTDLTVAKALPFIRARMPAGTALVILSRNPPPSVLNDLLIKGTLKQITDLQFTNKEIVSLFDKNQISISKHEAESLLKQTGGWAAALSAILISQKGRFSGVLNRDTLNSYLKSHVFEYWDNFHILKKCSICETLNPELCAAVTGQAGAWEAIMALADKTGLVSRLDKSAYRFHALLRDFLLTELENDKSINKEKLYANASCWYKENDNIFLAVEYAAKSNDLELIADMLVAVSDSYGEREADVSAYIQAVDEKLLRNMPKSIIEDDPRFTLDYLYTAFLLGRREEMCEWIDVVKKQFAQGRIDTTVLLSMALLLSMDPRESSWCMPKRFSEVMPILQKEAVVYTTSFSLTQNLPFFHRGERDFTDISPELKEYILVAKDTLAPLLGVVYKPLELLLLAGVHYERNELDEAEALILEAVEIAEHFTPEFIFSTFCLYAEIKRCRGQDASSCFERISTMISATGAHYLTANFDAVTTRNALMQGDTSSAAAWLERSGLNDSQIKLYKIEQYFTAARAMIVLGRLTESEKLLKRLEVFSERYRRNADCIESLILQAICMWNTKRADDAVKAMITAIRKAEKLQLMMPIIKEGRDILPILQKILNRLKYGYDIDILDKAFVNTLFLEAQSISQYTRGMFAQRKSDSIKLSPRQKEILGYLGQNLSYQEIGDKIGVKVTTIDDHIGKLYDKLEVSNARDAVLKARKIGLINMR